MAEREDAGLRAEIDAARRELMAIWAAPKFDDAAYTQVLARLRTLLARARSK